MGGVLVDLSRERSVRQFKALESATRQTSSILTATTDCSVRLKTVTSQRSNSADYYPIIAEKNFTPMPSVKHGRAWSILRPSISSIIF